MKHTSENISGATQECTFFEEGKALSRLEDENTYAELLEHSELDEGIYINEYTEIHNSPILYTILSGERITQHP